MPPHVAWPEGRSFAFTIFDDPDAQTLAMGREVYAFLADLGFRTTKGVWPIWGTGTRVDWGETCDDAPYREWCLELAAGGFEMGYHNATQYTSDRATTRRGLDRYAELFGRNPATMSNHYNCLEDIYWAEHRVTGVRRRLYDVLTRGANRGRSFGHVEGHPLYWGDLCRERITYVRNFVYARVNTLDACPYMPYHDPRRPLVKYWYASSEGSDVRKFTGMISEANQDRLAEEGGACIMYTHFGHGYVADGKLDPEFRRLMTRLRDLGGWYVPVADVLGHLRARRARDAGTNGAAAVDGTITDAQRAELEWRWLWDKARSGTS